MTHEQQLFLALLVLGHVLGDFAFQTRAMVEGKLAWRGGAFGRHALTVLAMHAATLLPVFPTGNHVVLVAGIAVAHLLVDLGKTALSRAWNRPFTWFALDQVAHLAVLWVLGGLLADTSSCTLPADLLPQARAVAVVPAVLVFDVTGGSAVVALILRDLRGARHVEAGGDTASGARAVTDDADDVLHGAGHWIGVLERLLVTLAVLRGEWGAVGLVLTAKSIARFKELEDRRFSEIYLVGTMTSVLVAIACGMLLARLVPGLAG